MDRIGKYEIASKLLSTGFSDIYVARDPDMNTTVAVKVFHPKGSNVGSEAKYGPDFWRERFVEEAKLLATFDHPNIINVMALERSREREPFMVMPFMDANLLYEIGEDEWEPEEVAKLSDRWKPRPISPRRAMEVWRQGLAALNELHQRNLVHRDIKPPNFLLTSKKRGTVKLCDFGMVKVPDAKGSRSGIWVGTLDYISPEQRKSATDVDVRSDLYSMGVVAFRMLTGQLPKKVRPPLVNMSLGLPVEACRLIEACLAKKPADRPDNAGAALGALDAAIPGIDALSDTLAAKPTPRKQRRARAKLTRIS